MSGVDKRSRTRMPEDKALEAVELRRGGMSPREIGGRLGFSRATIQRALQARMSRSEIAMRPLQGSYDEDIRRILTERPELNDYKVSQILGCNRHVVDRVRREMRGAVDELPPEGGCGVKDESAYARWMAATKPAQRRPEPAAFVHSATFSVAPPSGSVTGSAAYRCTVN